MFQSYDWGLSDAISSAAGQGGDSAPIPDAVLQQLIRSKVATGLRHS